MSVARSSLVTLLVTEFFVPSMLLKEETPCCQDLWDLRKDARPWRAGRDQKIQSETLVWKDCLSPKWTMGTLNMTKSDPFGTHWRLWSIERTKIWLTFWFDAKDLRLCSMTYHTALGTTRHLLSQCMTKLLLSLWPPWTLQTWQCGRCGMSVPCELTRWLREKSYVAASQNTKSKHPGIELETFKEGRLDELDTGVKRDGKARSNSRLQCQGQPVKAFPFFKLIQFRTEFNHIQPPVTVRDEPPGEENLGMDREMFSLYFFASESTHESTGSTHMTLSAWVGPKNGHQKDEGPHFISCQWCQWFNYAVSVNILLFIRILAPNMCRIHHCQCCNVTSFLECQRIKTTRTSTQYQPRLHLASKSPVFNLCVVKHPVCQKESVLM